jgi:hypothetical protein
MDRAEFIFMAIAAAICVFVGYAVYTENTSWNEFAAEHDCKIVERKASTASYGIGTSGNYQTIVNPSQVAFLCDDGITYWRSQ